MNNISLCPICGKAHEGPCPSKVHSHHDNGHCHCHGHSHSHSHTHGVDGKEGFLHTYVWELVVLLLLSAGMVMDHFRLLPLHFSIIYYLVAVMPVGWEIVKDSFYLWRKGDVMNEFTLMLLAAIGAFAIGEFPEGVAVLLFYSFGEKLQDSAADDVRRRIRSLVSKMPQEVTIINPSGARVSSSPEAVAAGAMLVVKPGERIAIDGVLASDFPCDMDTSALTGESVPRCFNPGEEVNAGIMPVDREVMVRTLRPFSDSTLSRMMKMIDEASAAKTPTETMLRRITRWFTPTVITLALLVFLVPWIVSWFTSGGFDAVMWLRRSLVFFVCSCPCALVVSIPLGYFASLGNAARKGLLFKGAVHIDVLRDIDTMVFDKTGTITTGKFHVSATEGADSDTLLVMASSIDLHSSHPLAIAIVEEAEKRGLRIEKAEEVATVPHGMTGRWRGHQVMVGSGKMLEQRGILVPESDCLSSRICVASDGKYIGSIFLDDTIKEEGAASIAALRKAGIKEVMILSGDRDKAVGNVADAVGADSYRASLMPEDKYKAIEALKRVGRKVAFVGDGINDAPSIASADIGIAMGTLGTDMAMESADVIIAGDNLAKLAEGIRLSHKARRVVIENVFFAFGIKGIVMVLAAFGIATLWAGVFADTGVTLITILWTLFRLRMHR